MNPSNFQFSSLERIVIERVGLCAAFFFFFLMVSKGSFRVSIVMHKESLFSATISQHREEHWELWFSKNEKVKSRSF